ncbi:unnamed protein product [Periconia digitata]|uniref:Uncharacterized protein n=1 Tax=Periconia digitata TaxID=1303443 RepID=A0A9W4UAG9_9PLEO|nr:unnamed protein product [Periconia digitata]
MFGDCLVTAPPQPSPAELEAAERETVGSIKLVAAAAAVLYFCTYISPMTPCMPSRIRHGDFGYVCAEGEHIS